ncbi:MAG: LTA synthase family protein [Atopobiaceae bacterium]|nr:LTA synthase family protein [Atopobiaceae bacterium]
MRQLLQRHQAQFERWYLCGTLIWLEVAFKVSTTGGFWPALLFLLAFSLAGGLVLELLCTLAPSARANKIAKCLIALFLGVVFCIEYFVYREFKLFYDLNTVLSGAADATTGFSGQIAGLVFSPTGIGHIVLFLIPALAYALLGTGEAPTEPEKAKAQRIVYVRNAAISYAAALVLVFTMGTFGRTYTDQYSFPASVDAFGLITSLRKEVQAQATGGTQRLQFSTKTDAGASNQTESRQGTKKDAAPQAKKYEPNVLDINFKKLAKSTEGTWAELDRYVDSCAPSTKNEMTGRFKGYNLIFVTAEALSSEAIRKDTTPTLWRMSRKGIQFTDYYQFDSAGTTGGECANVFGLLPTEGGSSVKMTATHNNYLTIGNALNRLGYNGWAFHNNTYTYYSRDQTHNNLGYDHGFMGYGNGIEQWVTWQWPQSDLEMVRGTFKHLYGSTAHEPFNVYYMSVSGHSGYTPGENAMSQKHWDKVADLEYSDPVKGYLACNIELDRAMSWLIKSLKRRGMADHTLIVMGADHFPYGLDDDGPLGSLPYTSELYGYDVQTYFQRDHNRLIMWSPSLEKEEPIVVDTPTSAIDILPTLLNLFGCEWDSRLLPGRDVFSNKEPLAFNLSYDWKSDLGTYYAGSGEFVPNDDAKKIPEDYVAQKNEDVANRINYCRGVLTTDYYRHVFGDPENVNKVHDAAARK